MPLTISSHVIALAVIGVKRMIPDSVIATAFFNICLPPAPRSSRLLYIPIAIIKRNGNTCQYSIINSRYICAQIIPSERCADFWLTLYHECAFLFMPESGLSPSLQKIWKPCSHRRFFAIPDALKKRPLRNLPERTQFALKFFTYFPQQRARYTPSAHR